MNTERDQLVKRARLELKHILIVLDALELNLPKEFDQAWARVQAEKFEGGNLHFCMRRQIRLLEPTDSV